MNKKAALLVLSIVVLNILTSCTGENEEIVKKSDGIDFTSYAENWSNQDKKNIKKENNTTELSQTNNEWDKELVIDERCIWCGKCAMIAPNNFAMDFNTLKAVVISQKNMFSEEVTMSAQVCPTNSIHIS